MKTNRLLAVAAAALFLLSALSYHESVSRAERFERGQKFLPNLNPDEIARITIRKGETETVLNRRDDSFAVASENGYPADNAEVNRLIKDVLELGLEKEVGRDAGLYEELGLAPGAEGTVEVAFANTAGSEMVRFLVGKAFEGEGGGNYVRRADAKTDDEGDGSAIYLTSARVYLDTEGDDYVKKEILNIDRAEVSAIIGPDFRIAKAEEGGDLTLEELPAGKKEGNKANQVKGALSGLRFTQHHLADAPEVQGLVFDGRLEVEMGDQSGYVIESAERDGKYYLRIQAFHDVGQVQIALDASEDEVRETSEMLTRGDELADFNEIHGSWVYEVTSTIGERMRWSKADLLEDA